MNQEEAWVSHTPDDTSHCKKETEEDFISAAAETNQIRSISPPTPFEKFFLPIAEDDGNILANRLRKVNKNTVSSRSASSESVLTEDFCSAHGTEVSDLDDLSFEENPIKNIYANDILGIAHPTTIVEEDDDSEKMVRSKTTKVDPTSTPETPEVAEPEVTTPAPTTTASKDPNFDVIENVYEGAKAAWSFGKGIVLFRPFMGLAEDAATKVLSMTTGAESLEAVDKDIIHHLSGIDKEFIDPAILKLCSVISPIIGKGDDIIKSMVGIFVKPALGSAK